MFEPSTPHTAQGSDDRLADLRSRLGATLEDDPATVKQSMDHVKMVFVGEGGAGKTSTIEALTEMISCSRFKRSTVMCQTSTIAAELSAKQVGSKWQTIPQDQLMGLLGYALLARLHKDSSGPTPGTAANITAEACLDYPAAPQPHPTPASLQQTPGPTPNPAPATVQTQVLRKRPQQVRLLVDDALLCSVAARRSDTASDTGNQRRLRFSIWDLAGQTVFYDVLPISVTRFALYFLCFSMKQMLEDAVGCLLYVKFWLVTILTHAPGSKIFLIGTHKDVVGDSMQHRKISQELVPCLASYSTQIIQNSDVDLVFWPVNNMHPATDLTLLQLRTVIESTALQQAWLQLEVPTTWLACYDQLRVLARKSSLQCVSLSEFESLANGLDIPGAQQALLLQVFHEYGMWLHYPDTRLRHLIILDPQWVIDAFALVIRDYTLHPYPSTMQADVLKHHSALLRLRKARLDHAVLMDCLWKHYSPEQRTMLLQLMINFNLIVPIRDADKHGHNEYLVLSLLPPDQASAGSPFALSDGMSQQILSKRAKYPLSPLNAPGTTTSCYLAVLPQAENQHDDAVVTLSALEESPALPYGVFGRLLCELLRQCQIAKCRSDGLSLSSAVFHMAGQDVVLQLDLVADVPCICLRTNAAAPAPLVKLVSETLKFVISSHFRSKLQMLTLLPGDATCLVRLSAVQEHFVTMSSLWIGAEFLTHVRLRERYGALLVQPGLKDFYHLMISYRWANSQFVALLYNRLGREVLLNQGGHEPMEVFYDCVSLVRGEHLQLGFCNGLSRSLVAVPIISLQALERMKALDTSVEEDNVLLEWMLMLQLKHLGAVNRVLPIVLGDHWGNDCAPPTVSTLEDLKKWVRQHLPEAPAPATVSRLKHFLQQLHLPVSSVSARRRAWVVVPGSNKVSLSLFIDLRSNITGCRDAALKLRTGTRLPLASRLSLA